MKKILNYFFQGLLYIAPIGLTIYIIYLLFELIDEPLQTYIKELFGVQIPGLGVLIIFVIITLLGIIGGSIIANPFKRIMDKLLERAPILKLIYSSIRDLLSAFVGKEKKFNTPVLVKLNMGSDVERVGFLTQEDLNSFGIKEKVAVYFPQSYTFAGDLYIVPSKLVTLLDMAPANAMKFAVSGGVAMN